MFSISSCPHCGQQVLISSELSAECLVRCLICEAEFPLSQALVNAVDAPPELMPVARVGEEKGSGGEEEKGRRGEEETPPAPSLLLPCSPVSNDSPRDIYALAGSGEADKRRGAQSSAVPAVSHSEAAALWRSRQKPPVSSLGSAGKAVAIVAGGFLGVAVAYFVLSIVSPSRFDFLHLWGHPKQGTSVPASGSKESGPAGQVRGKFDRDNPSFSDLEEKRSSSRAKKP
jgi:hypothetical protein